jgi:hypothetical protein
MKTSGSLQEFVEEITKAIRKLSPEEKREFREAWLSQVAERERTTENDRRFLRSVGIEPDGD